MSKEKGSWLQWVKLAFGGLTVAAPIAKLTPWVKLSPSESRYELKYGKPKFFAATTMSNEATAHDINCKEEAKARLAHGLSTNEVDDETAIRESTFWPAEER